MSVLGREFFFSLSRFRLSGWSHANKTDKRQINKRTINGLLMGAVYIAWEKASEMSNLKRWLELGLTQHLNKEQ